MMKTHVRPVRDLRNNYAEIAEIVKNHDQVIITKNGRGDSVLINIDEYAEIEKIRHERYVAEKLAEAEELSADPNTKWYTHEEFWSKFGL